MRRQAIKVITFVGGLFFLLEFVLPGDAPEPAGKATTQPVAVATRPAAGATRPASGPAAKAVGAAARRGGGRPSEAVAARSKDKQNILTPALPNVAKFLLIVGTMAFLLGPINLVRSHLKNLSRRGEGRLGSIAFLVFLCTGALAASLRTRSGNSAGPAKPADVRGEATSQGARRPPPSSAAASAPATPPDAKAAPKDRTVPDVVYDALIFGVSTAFFASSMALLAFYLVSAAHRAFRLSTIESGLMMVAAVIVLLGQVPAGDWLTYRLPEFVQLRSWAQWILMFPNAGVQRAVLIGAGGGAIAAAVRHWLSLGRAAE